MTLQMILLLAIVGLALVVFVGGWIRVDVVGLLVLSALALTGLVSTQEALAGFSSPAVVTVWAMFILSAGLSRTGIAHWLGKPLHRLAKRGEVTILVALMVTASLFSALINTVTVAAILLPTTMELSRRSGIPPSRLLMPLALGCLLGGPFTAISTPPNILITDALRTAGLQPFALLDFTPITAMIVAVGVTFMAVVGRRLLPKHRDNHDADSHSLLDASYELNKYLFSIGIREGSPLVGCSLAQSRLGSALFLTAVAIQRKGVFILAPRPTEVLQAKDTVIVHGRARHLAGWHHLTVETLQIEGESIANCVLVAEARIPNGSSLVGTQLGRNGFRKDHGIHVIAFAEHGTSDLRWKTMEAGDKLLVQATREALEKTVELGILAELRFVEPEAVSAVAGERIAQFALRVPEGSVLADHDLVEGRLGNAFGLTVVGIGRGQELRCGPSATERVFAGDLLILQGSPRDLEILQGLQELEMARPSTSLIEELESQRIGVTEVLLSPRTELAGKTLTDLLFREHYGLSVLAIWRKGRAYRSELQSLPLQFGDALLVYGQRNNLQSLGKDANFLVLDDSATQAPRLEKAGIAAVIMLAVLGSAIFGLVPIAVAGITGAAFMVLMGCLSMEEAYRAIDWRAVFLIASMLPLGVAIENTGLAQLAAESLMGAVGHLNPRWVVAALFGITVLGNQVVPGAALVVLMSPIALSTASNLSISPHLLMMTIAIAATTSYSSPLSHPAHQLVMGPGGYRFTDYVKVGTPIVILAFFLAVGVLPILWPP